MELMSEVAFCRSVVTSFTHFLMDSCNMLVESILAAVRLLFARLVILAARMLVADWLGCPGTLFLPAVLLFALKNEVASLTLARQLENILPSLSEALTPPLLCAPCQLSAAH